MTDLARERFDRLVQRILAPGARSHLAARASEWLTPLAKTDPALDVGCGYGSPLSDLGRRLIGVDKAESRVRSHCRNFTSVVANAVALPFAEGHFAASISIGLLHHLGDDAARQAIGEMTRVVRPRGPVIVFDGVLPSPAWRHPVAALIRALDHGHHMRGESELRGLFDGFSDWRFERVVYAVTGLEGLWCIGGSRSR